MKQVVKWQFVLSILLFIGGIILSIHVNEIDAAYIHRLLPPIKIGNGTLYYSRIILFGVYFAAVETWFRAFKYKASFLYKIGLALLLMVIFSSLIRI